MRFVVALYLVIVTAAGPWACCCTFARLTARLSAATPHDHVTAKAHSCCKPQGQERAGADPASEPARQRHGPLSPDCPCKQGSECSSQALALTHDESRSDTLRALAAEFVSPSGGSQLSQPAPAPHAVLPPSWAHPGGLSTDDLLHVLHMMRC
ncbi:MAG: hypothetical protein U0797_07930 [Gemmataceae bacterium]